MDGARPDQVRHGPVCSIYGPAISGHLWRLLPMALKIITITTTTAETLKKRKTLHHQMALEGLVMGNIILILQFADGSILDIGKLSANL